MDGLALDFYAPHLGGLSAPLSIAGDQTAEEEIADTH